MNITLAIIGFIMLILMMVLILKNKVLPAAAFAILPVLAALIGGFSIPQIMEFINKGLGTVWKTAALFIFSVSFFGVMIDAGMFDQLVNRLVKMSGSNVPLVMVATALIAVVGHLDGSAASTYLITIPVMLPIYKKLKLNIFYLLLICGLATGVMNLLPWGGPTLRAATAINMDVNLLWKGLIPMQVVGLVITLAAAFLLGMMEKKRLLKEGVDLRHVVIESDGVGGDDSTLKRPQLLWFNYLLTAIVIVCLVIKTGLPPFVVFMFGLLIALAVNYPNPKDMQKRLQAHAADNIVLVVTLFAAGVFLGILSESGIINAMASALISILPQGLVKYLHIIMGVLGAPLGMVMGPDPYYYAVMPLVIEAVAPFGVTAQSVANAMLIGENVGLSVSPCVPVTFLLIGLAGVELKDHIKANFKWCWAVSVLMLVFGIVIGIV